MSLWLVGMTAAAVGAACAIALHRRSDRKTPVNGGLANLALEAGAVGAIRLPVGGGTAEQAGTIPADLNAALKPIGIGPLHEAIAALTASGTPFRLAAEGGADRVYDGALRGGAPVILVRPASTRGPAGSVDQRLRELAEHVPHPVWITAPDGERLWSNAAYGSAAGAPALGADDPLLDANAAQKLDSLPGAAVSERVQTVVREKRRHLDVTEHRGAGVARFAIDVTDAVAREAAFSHQIQSHADTLDRLATAIAIYGPDRRLAFYNTAFRALWEQPATFLDDQPHEERVLDRLRAEGRLPESADPDAWKAEAVRTFESREPSERWWHLPDGQTLRVIANPGSDGGVTYIFENVTEQLALERRFNALSRVQAETIDGLGEGIATFGPDGLLRLANPAFWTLTGVAQADVGAHVRIVAAGAPGEDMKVWTALAERVTGLSDRRTTLSGRIERPDGQVLDYAFSPLPDGATLAAVVDMTDTVNVARALSDRNVALEEADRLKNAFIEHVSYELRSPLNTIIGFTQMLTLPHTGPLSEKQREYADYISTSSEALLTIIDGILDLATIDAGIMELQLEPVDVSEAAREVMTALKDRVAEAGLTMEVHVAPDAAVFEGDLKRVRQVLFNLVSNAVSHSPEGGVVTVAARLDGADVALSVRDRGPGIADGRARSVFERFTTEGTGGRRGGVGLGLSLVKSFVELHGGSVAVGRVDGPGAELIVRFPKTARAAPREAA